MESADVGIAGHEFHGSAQILFGEFAGECAHIVVIPGGALGGGYLEHADWGNVNYGAGGEVIADEFPVMWNYNANDAIMAEDYDGQIKLVLPAKAKDPAES